MIPFERTWPYETMKDDVYVSECPFCRRSNVLLPLKKAELAEMGGARRRRLVFPCCHSVIHIVDADRDYLLTDRKLR